MKRVTFKSHGLELAGNLFLPYDFDAAEKYPAVVVTGSWTTVKEQMANFYAEKLARENFVTLTFDFRSFGESQGMPREYENPRMKTADILSAVTYLQGLTFVNRDQVFGLGVCASSGYMADAAAADSRIKAIGLVAPWMHDLSIVEEMYGGADGVNEKIQKSRTAYERFVNGGQVEYMPAADPNDKNAAMPLPNVEHWDYYYRKDLGAIAQYQNRLAVMSWEPWLTYDGTASGGVISQPVVIVHSEAAAIPHGAKRFYERLQGKKDQLWLDNVYQLDFYHMDNVADQALERVSHFLNVHIGSNSVARN